MAQPQGMHICTGCNESHCLFCIFSAIILLFFLPSAIQQPQFQLWLKITAPCSFA